MTDDARREAVREIERRLAHRHTGSDLIAWLGDLFDSGNANGPNAQALAEVREAVHGFANGLEYEAHKNFEGTQAARYIVSKAFQLRERLLPGIERAYDAGADREHENIADSPEHEQSEYQRGFSAAQAHEVKRVEFYAKRLRAVEERCKSVRDYEHSKTGVWMMANQILALVRGGASDE